VVDVHPVKRGDRVGYRQRKVGKDGLLVVVSGGTAHGIGLEAPAVGDEVEVNVRFTTTVFDEVRMS
jgi:hypothetical protein